ncbi:LapA family protein [Streptomyces sp. O3]
MSAAKGSSSGGGGKGPSTRGGRVRELMTPGRLTVAGLGILGLVFIFENTDRTKIRLLIPEVTLPLWMALLATALIGALCGAYFVRRRR